MLIAPIAFGDLFQFFCCKNDTTNLAKQEFQKYHNGSNVVLIIDDSHLYFEDYTLQLGELVSDEEVTSCLIADKIYFSTSKQNGIFNFDWSVYRCNLDGTDIQKIYSKQNLSTHPWAISCGNMVYVEYYTNHAFDSSGRAIDAYNIVTEEYYSVSTGGAKNLADYAQDIETPYHCTIKKADDGGQYFEIANLETQETQIVNDEYINNTIYAASMHKFGYAPMRMDVSDGCILLTYSIGAGDGQNCAHLIFAYDFETDTLTYQAIVFPYDRDAVTISHINQ